jgi:hypothetical protein
MVLVDGVPVWAVAGHGVEGLGVLALTDDVIGYRQPD